MNQSKYDPHVLNHKLQSADDLCRIHKIMLGLGSSLRANSKQSFAQLFKHGKFVCGSDGNNVLHHLCADDKFIDAVSIFPVFLAYDPS